MKKKLLLSLLAVALAGPTFAQFSIKKVVFEEFTGAWCQYCADGAYRAEVMDNDYPEALMVAVHDGDAMEMTDGVDLAAFYTPAYPQALFNRGGALISRGSWNSTMSSQLQGAGSVTVAFDSVDYNAQTRQITADVSALFTAPLSGDMRINLIIVEDEVTGTGAGYNQVNADNGTPGHPYQGAGNPIVGFVHRHVARDYVEGAWGLAGLIPNTVNFGSSVNHTFTYTIPGNFDASKIELIAYVGRYDGAGMGDREILNGEEFFLSTLIVGAPSMSSNAASLEIIGNPLTDRSKIVYSTEEAGIARVEILNMLGQQIATLEDSHSEKGIHTLYWDGKNGAGASVDNGMYLVRVVTEAGKSMSKRILVAH
ncbi:MAG: Omp28-related outer membrane protein [Bacteroidetes bacterium]|nr:Omp28-related outer membrane protein [Bacteroidota bacterium]